MCMYYWIYAVVYLWQITKHKFIIQWYTIVYTNDVTFNKRFMPNMKEGTWLKYMLRNGRMTNFLRKKNICYKMKEERIYETKNERKKTNGIFYSKSKGKKKTIFWNTNRRRKPKPELMEVNNKIEGGRRQSHHRRWNKFYNSIRGDENNDIQLYLIIKLFHIIKYFILYRIYKLFS